MKILAVFDLIIREEEIFLNIPRMEGCWRGLEDSDKQVEEH